MTHLSFLGKKGVLTLLLAIVVLSLILRYPLVEHERHQTDSYYIHLLSGSVVENGYAKWTFSVLSYFGYYPFSYPSGVPFLLSELSMTTGLSVESTILFTNMIFGSLFCLAMFMLARVFIDRHEYMMLAVMLAVVGSRFVDTTYWNASARGPAIVMIVLLIALLMRRNPATTKRVVGVAGALGLGCFSFHHMAVLLIPFASAYIIWRFEIDYLLRKFCDRRKHVAVVFNVAILGTLMCVSFALFDFYGNLLLVNLQKTSLFNVSPPALSVILNTASAYTNQIGFILPVAILGFMPILKHTRLTARTLYIFLCLVVFVPLLGNHLYMSMLLAPFVAVIGSLAINSIPARGVGKKLLVTGIAILVSSSIVMPLWSISKWNSNEYLSGDTVEVGYDLYNDATYLRYSADDACVISNVEFVSLQAAANSDIDFLGPGMMLILNGDITNLDIERNISLSETVFPVNLYKWFQYVGTPNMDNYVGVLMIYGYSILSEDSNSADTREYFQRHAAVIVFVDSRWDGQFVGIYSIRKSLFLEELYECEYVAYSGEHVYIDSYCYYSSERSSLYLSKLIA